jgi:two-component system chemotaxis sensor kinase CheA
MDFEELYADFFVEALGLLDDFEETFVNMESSDSPEKDMSQIFRVAHSIKGGAGALGFKEITEFTHCLEDILSYLRIHPEKLTPEIVTLCLDSADQLRKCFLNLQKNPQAVTHFNMTKLKEVSLSLNGNLHGDSDASQENLENEIKSSEDVSLENSELMPSLNTKEPQNFENSQVSDLSSKIESVQEVVSKQSLASEAQASEGDKSNKSQAKNSRIIKVDAHRLDNILDIVGELVVLKNQLLHDDAFRVSESTRAASVIDQIDKNVRDLYDKTLGMRMTPLKALFTKLQRIVRDVSLQLDKSVQLKLQGEDTEVERNVFDLLSDPLVHIVRNALDHGIEIPEKRKAANKPAQASLTIFAQQSGGKVVIEVIDDGNGIDREKILKKAIEKDLVTPNMNVAQMSDEQVFQFLFMPGFSTAEKISDLSGRGVGLDVVKTNLEKINGKIDVKSKLGHGTTFICGHYRWHCG